MILDSVVFNIGPSTDASYFCSKINGINNSEDSKKEMRDWSRRNWRYTNQDMYNEIMQFISKCNGNYICIHPDYIEDKVTELCAYLMTNEVKFKKREYNKFYKENINQR